MGRFASVRPPSSAVSTKRKESASLNSLYEVKELHSIGDVNETENVDPAVVESLPVVNTASNASWLAIALGGDVSMFNVLVDCSYETGYQLEDGTVCGLSWLCESHLLAIFTSDRRFILVSPKFGVLLDAKVHNDGVTRCDTAIVSSTDIGDQCIVCITDSNGITDTVMFSYWSSSLSMNDSETSKADLKKIVSSAVFNCTQSKYIATEMIASKGLSAMIYRTTSSDAFNIFMFASGEFGQLDNTFVGDASLTGPITRTREVCNGRYLVGVTSTGQMIIHDLWSLFHLTAEKPIDLKIGSDSRVVDFIFIEPAKDEFAFKNVVVVVEKKNGYSLLVISLPGGDVSYSLDMEKGTSLLYADSEATQRVMMLVEPIVSGHGVSLKEIVQAEPEQKLTRLIEQNRLDEAEQFAEEFGLDCQRVHVARMYNLFEETSSNPSPDVFKKFMTSMDKVADHNRVGETCYSGAAVFKDYARIQALLQYAETRKITDNYCAEKLSDLAYVFGTYRMVTNPENDSFDHWAIFTEGVDGPGKWLDIFDSYLAGGYIAEARVIYNRHTKHILEGIVLDIEISVGVEGTIFEKMKAAVYANAGIWKDLTAFLEFDLIPRIIQGSSVEDKLYCFMVDFLVHLAKHLEKFEAADFPDNALHGTGTLERICRSMALQAITPAKEALVALVGRKYFTAESRTSELVVYSKNLEAIKRLKDVYQCSLSYETYTTLNAERICYRILQSAVENPAMVAARVAKFARPYMDEHRLDPDRTIFRYIEDVAKNALFVLSGANPWHEQCLLVSETIENFSLRCQAILMIAQSMQPPWPKKLSDAIQSILRSNLIDEDLTKRLQRVCHRADLGKILQSHNVSFSLLDTVLSNERQFTRIVMYLVQQEGQLEDLVKSALKAVDLYGKLNSDSAGINDRLVYSSIAIHLLGYYGVKQMITYLDRLETVGDGVQSGVIENLIDRLFHRINSTVQFEEKGVIAERLNTIYAIESIIQHFKTADPEMQTVYSDIVLIRKLQERYNRWITVTQLYDEDWKIAEFHNFLQIEQRQLPELYAFASAINLKPELARMMAIEYCILGGSLTAIATVLKEAITTVAKPSKKLVERYVVGCEYIFNNLYKYCCPSNHYDNVDVIIEEAMDVIWMMKPILSGLTEAAVDNDQFLEKALRMEHFVKLFLRTFEQFILDDSPQANDAVDGQEHYKEDRICGMSRRLGVYLIDNDGPIMNKKEMVTLLFAVAPSVVMDYDTSPDHIALMNDLHNKWDDLCNILVNEHQDVLNYLFRIFSAYLPCFFGSENLIHKNLTYSTKNLCEKTFQAHPCDLWTACAVHLCQPPTEAMMFGLQFRNWVSQRKSPQTMLNYFRVMQFVAICVDNHQFDRTLSNSFIQNLWCKRMAKAGCSFKNTKECYPLLEEFAKGRIDPGMVAEFLAQFFTEEADDQMLNYAMNLVAKASSASTVADVDAYLQTAKLAMKLCNSGRNHIYWRCRRALYALCPYSYEPILFLIRLMLDCVTKGETEVQSQVETDPKEPGKFVSGCINLMELLNRTNRSGPITRAEINWYMQYQKVYQVDLRENGSKDTNRKFSDCVGTRLMAWFEQGSDMNMVMERGESDLRYERADFLASALPPRAHNAIPVHLFLSQDQSDISRWLVPVIDAEVNLYTFKVWKTLRKQISWLHYLPPEMFLLKAVLKKVEECITKGLELQEMDKTQIMDLFLNNSSMEDVVNCIAHSAKTLTLSVPKIQLISLGVDVANEMIADPQIKESTKTTIEELRRRYEGLVQNYRTELLLKREGLYDGKSSDLVEQPMELISHIYSDCIDWNSSVDIQRKARLVEDLASINNVVLSEIQHDLIFRWLAEGEVSDAMAVNLDDTMGSISLPTTVDVSADDSELIPLPLFESSITKIVHLLKQLNYSDLVGKIYAKYVKEYTSTSGGYKTAIRAACALLRTLTDEDYKASGLNPIVICGTIETTLCTRLFEVARVEQPYSSYINQDKLPVVRSLMVPTKRHTPELCTLAAALVIDNELDDKNLIETLLNKLSQSRKKAIYNELLKHCKATPSLHAIKNLGAYWPRLVDYTAMHEYPRDEALYWIYFLVGCPVPLRGFDPIRVMSQKLPVAATVLSVASNFTKSIPKISNYDSYVSNAKDPHFGWAAGLSSTKTSASSDSMEF